MPGLNDSCSRSYIPTAHSSASQAPRPRFHCKIPLLFPFCHYLGVHYQRLLLISTLFYLLHRAELEEEAEMLFGNIMDVSRAEGEAQRQEASQCSKSTVNNPRPSAATSHPLPPPINRHSAAATHPHIAQTHPLYSPYTQPSYPIQPHPGECPSAQYAYGSYPMNMGCPSRGMYYSPAGFQQHIQPPAASYPSTSSSSSANPSTSTSKTSSPPPAATTSARTGRKRKSNATDESTTQSAAKRQRAAKAPPSGTPPAYCPGVGPTPSVPSP